MVHRQTALAATTILAGSYWAGCTIVRDGSSYITVSGTNSIAGDISQRGAATLPGHPLATAVIIIASVALLAALTWLIHNRGKLAGLAARITTGL